VHIRVSNTTEILTIIDTVTHKVFKAWSDKESKVSELCMDSVSHVDMDLVILGCDDLSLLHQAGSTDRFG
jgi:hypothetical protein